MRVPQVRRATAAAVSTAVSLRLPVDDTAVLHDSNKLTLRLLPCDVLARVAPEADQVAHFEVDLAQRLAGAGCPVGTLDPRVAPRVHRRDGFVITLWTYYEPATAAAAAPADYADALARLHAGMRRLDITAPHFTDRVQQAQDLVADPGRTPALADADRELLRDTLRDLRHTVGEHRAADQLLHGEPHPGNVLGTRDGLLFIDFETCCRGPVEFDLAHAPEAVAAHCPGVDQDLLRACRLLILAMVTAWRWDRDDQFPDGLRMGRQWLVRIRAALGDAGPATHG
ncbi:phosphotransferase [Streptomyces sp. NPDC023723]|uniref:phosphotransferase family protein n=1 Tax=Streptomyces sp. NPDC023723 TaxID=3154323 RepID=UPI0033EFD2CD